jgi:glycosyltransferase 2 family protein
MADEGAASGRQRLRFDAPAVTAQLFASDRHAPRRRRPTDVVLLATCGIAVAGLWWAASLGAIPLDERIASALTLASGLLRSLAWLGYTASGLYVVGLLAATFARSGRGRGVVRDVVLAVVMVSAASLIGARSVDGSWPDVLPELFDHTAAPTYPAFRLALVVVIVGVEGPYLAMPVRRIGRWTIGVAATATLLLGFATFSGVVTSMLLGLAVTAAVRLCFGSPEGLPSVSRLAGSLARLGVEASELAYDETQHESVGRARAIGPAGHPLRIKVYGRDAADAQRAERIWRTMWYRSAGPSPGTGRFQLVEHEALGMLVAERFGVSTGTLVAAGQDENGDALLVTIPPPGAPLGGWPDLDESQLGRLWDALGRLQDRYFAHGSIGAHTVWVDGPEVSLVDLEGCTLTATDQQLGSDAAAMLVATAGVVGGDRAVDALVRAWPPERVAAVLPYVQERALPPSTRQWADDRDVDVPVLRTLLVERLGIEAPQLVELRRVSLGGLVMTAFALLAANAIVGQIAEIGFDTLMDEIRAASVAWLVVAFLIRIVSYGTGWVSMHAVVTEPVPPFPTVLLQSAKSFVGLVVPTTLGRVAMDVRYLQKLGTPTSVALAQGPLISFVGFVIEVSLLLLTVGSVTASLDTDAAFDMPSGGLVAIAVVAVVLAVVVVLVVGPLRRKIVPPVVEAVRSVRDVVVSPSRLGTVFLGELTDRILGALSLGAVVIAFGAHLSLAELIFVNVGVGLLAGLAPVPGGVGVAEAMLTGLLTAVGLPSEQAFAIAITYRVVTSYLPPVLGFFSLRYLTAAKYL